MEPGYWNDISEQGQFLLEMEFLTRHMPPAQNRTKPTVVAEMACVYTQSPPYLVQIAQQFPWIHFYAFQHMATTQGGDEYDPAQPDLVRATYPSLQTELNRTTSPFEFSKDSAITLSRVKEDRPDQRRLVMICHGETPTRQLVLHSFLRADFSLIDVSGSIPDEYLAGDMVMPIFLPQNKILVLLVVNHECKGSTYEPSLFKDEIGKSSICMRRLYPYTND
jgi:hypothetical protein